MGFVIQWVWYLLAFLLGSLVAWSVVVVSIKRTGSDETGAGS